jgi:glycosyltransferase involved in cell wall biosynthesis
MNRTAALSIVIPLYNEADFLREALWEIQRYVSPLGMKYEFILVDDGSIDDTWEIVHELSSQNTHIKGIKLSRNFGKESAISTGLSFASGEAVIVMDGDLQHPPELIPEMIKHWRDGTGEIIEAVKADRGVESFSSRMRSRLFYRIMRHLTDLDIDNASDYKLLDRKVVDAHNRLPESSRFFRGIISWLGFRRLQIPFSVKERPTGQSRWSLRQLIRLAINASTAFSSLPLHFITISGVFTFFISVIIGIQTLYMKLSGNAVSGFATVILLLLFIGSILMISLGIIGVYLSRIFEEVKRRPNYIIEDTINFTDTFEK